MDETARRELIRCRGLVSHLRTVLQGSTRESQCESVDLVIEEISTSLIKAHEALNPREIQALHPDLGPSHLSSRSSNGWSDDRRSKMAAIPDKRYRKPRSRAREHLTAQKIFSTMPMKDEHLWRKYGQKMIFGAKYPRCYFKCSQQKEQGCRATKHVQRTDDGDPPMYLNTYFGHHTCTNLLPDSQLYPDASSTSQQSLISFETGYPNIKQENPWSSWEKMPQFHQTSPEFMPSETSQVCPTELSYLFPSEMMSVGSSSSVTFSTNPMVSDVDLMVSLLESVAAPCSDVGYNLQDPLL